MSERTLYFAVYGTSRDWDESVEALLSTAALAREIGRRLVAQRTWLVRCRVRRVELTFGQVAEIVRRWGREDAARGQPVTHAEKMMPPYRAIYLAGYRSSRGAGGRGGSRS